MDGAPAEDTATEEKAGTFADLKPTTNPSKCCSPSMESPTFLTRADPRYVLREDEIVHEPHFYGIQVDEHRKSEGPGTFQKLMMDACAGSLWHTNVGGDDLIRNSQLQIKSPDVLDGDNIVPNSSGDILCPRDEGYYGGTESEYDTTTQMSDDMMESSEEGSDHEDEDITINKNNCALQEFVSSFSDSISKEDFICGRDFDYDHFKPGMDDTDLNETEAQAVDIENFGPDPDDNNCRNEVNEGIYATHNFGETQNVDIENLVEE